MRPIFGIDAGTIESSTIPTGEEAMHLDNRVALIARIRSSLVLVVLG